MAVSDASWDGDASRFTIEQWRASCLVDTGQGDPDSKGRYKLPVKEPGGALNRNAVHNAAGRVNQLQPASKRAAAARKLISLYRNQLHEDPPDSLTSMGGNRTGAPPTERLYTTSFSDGLRVEIRSMPDGLPTRVIGGYAAVFGKRSHPMGGLREVVEPSFFNKSQADGWPMAVARYEHDKLMLLGTVAGGTLRLNPDQNGLDYEVDLPQHRNDVWELAERRDLPGSSFSFQAYQDDWKLGDGGYPERHLVTGRLIDVAPTAVPAYPDATVEVAYRSLAMTMDAPVEDIEELAYADDLRKLFIRTDNIDKRDNMSEPETRSAPTQERTGVTINMYGGTADVKPAEPEPKPEAEPEVTPEVKPEVVAETKPETTPETPPATPPATPPEPTPAVAAALAMVPEVKEPAPESKPEPRESREALELRIRRNRALGNRPDDPIVPPEQG